MFLKKIAAKLLGTGSATTQELTPLYDLKGDYAENLRSRQFLQYNDVSLDRLFDEILGEVEGEFSGWALAESAVRFLFYYIMQAKISGQPYHIVELGGGQSTMFWKALSRKISEIAVTTWEHDPDFSGRLTAQTSGTPVTVSQKRLLQYSDDDWNKIFSSKTLQELDKALRSASPELVDVSEYANTRIHNAFYEFDVTRPESSEIDALVVDGPHGNGRSMAYAAFAHRMKVGTLILIDDVSHYAFLEHLSKFVQFTLLQTSFSLAKQWTLLRVDSVMANSHCVS